VVQRLGEGWTGRMVTARGLDQPRIAFPANNAPASLPLGAQVDLGLATRAMAKAVRCGAQLIAVEWAPEGVELTFDPDEPELFRDEIPGLVKDPPERRSSVRVFPRSGEGIRVPVRLQEDLAAKPLVARLCDASAGGLGLLFPYSSEEKLCFSRALLCEVVEPGGERREVDCLVRNRTLLPDGVRYGVEFVNPGSAAVQPFEPLWDCPCGETGLLAASHKRCLRCGRPRSTNTRLPHRDGLLSLPAHLYTGTDRRCRSCGATWSSAAKFCGSCGLGL
jgi:PilZ domain-containing protein